MTYVKGESGNPAGRPRGSRNRRTTAIEEALAQLVEDNLGNMSEWLRKMAVDDPKGAFQCTVNLLEFYLPKVSRVALPYETEGAQAAEKRSNEQVDEFLAACAKAIEEEQDRAKREGRALNLGSY